MVKETLKINKSKVVTEVPYIKYIIVKLKAEINSTRKY